MTPEEIAALDLKPGDKVRLTIDCEVDGDSDFIVRLDFDAIVSAERIEPPFKPGDVVRSRGNGLLFLLGETGYRGFANLANFHKYGSSLADEFRTDEFQRVMA